MSIISIIATITGILAVIFGGIVLVTKEENYNETIVNIFGCSILLFFASFVLFLVGLFINPVSSIDTPDKQQEIVSLSDNYQISGNTGFFRMTIEEEMYYAYYYKVNDNGEYKFGKILAENSAIFAIDEENSFPKVEIYKTTNYFGWFGELIATGNKYSYFYKIYVPEGTILTDFEDALDLN